ncbi:hypothetical protein NBRC116601_17680 [Cognatishimia sp. WU-CL00825]
MVAFEHNNECDPQSKKALGEDEETSPEEAQYSAFLATSARYLIGNRALTGGQNEFKNALQRTGAGCGNCYGCPCG